MILIAIQEHYVYTVAMVRLYKVLLNAIVDIYIAICSIKHKHHASPKKENYSHILTLKFQYKAINILTEKKTIKNRASRPFSDADGESRANEM